MSLTHNDDIAAPLAHHLVHFALGDNLLHDLLFRLAPRLAFRALIVCLHKASTEVEALRVGCVYASLIV
jgi:hypothetical protein